MSTSVETTQVIFNLVPAAVRNEIVSFVLYDNHPRDSTNIDITICTKSRELKEFHQRDLVSSVSLDSMSNPRAINIYRNRKAELFYLVSAGNDLLILNRKEKIRLLRKIPNVENYEIEDVTCQGFPYLKVYCIDDAVPLVFDDNLELQDTFIPQATCVDPPLPIYSQLQRKLTEAKYSVKCNEKIYQDLLHIRHLASYSLYEKINPNKSDPYKRDLKEISGILKIKTFVPWTKTCNGKFVIAFDIVNENIETLYDVQVLLHGTLHSSIVYTTKIYVRKHTPPYWSKEQRVKPNVEAVVVVVVDLKELKYNTLNRIKLNGFIHYKKMGEKSILPFDNVVISTSDTLKEDFDVLSDTILDDPKCIVALLATTIQTELNVRHIKMPDDIGTSIIKLFCTYIQMEEVPNMSNVIVHRRTPHHILHGIMIVFSEDYIENCNQCAITIHTSSESQVLALIHIIHDVIPAKLILTTPKYKLTSKLEEYSHFNEENINDKEDLKYLDYASSVLHRSELVLKYLDDMMVEMNNSKNQTVQSRIGKEIDMFAGGFEKYVEFRNHVLEEGAKGMNKLIESDTKGNENEAMIVD